MLRWYYTMALSYLSSVCRQNDFRAITLVVITGSFWIFNTMILGTKYRWYRKPTCLQTTDVCYLYMESLLFIWFWRDFLNEFFMKILFRKKAYGYVTIIIFRHKRGKENHILPRITQSHVRYCHHLASVVGGSIVVCKRLNLNLLWNH
jgi:hypothetical protein